MGLGFLNGFGVGSATLTRGTPRCSTEWGWIKSSQADWELARVGSTALTPTGRPGPIFLKKHYQKSACISRMLTESLEKRFRQDVWLTGKLAFCAVFDRDAYPALWGGLLSKRIGHKPNQLACAAECIEECKKYNALKEIKDTRDKNKKGSFLILDEVTIEQAVQQRKCRDEASFFSSPSSHLGETGAFLSA